MASVDDSALIWTRPEPGARRTKLSREQIAAAALAIADAEGFAAVSMRRIATELGTGTMTLYYYVRTKDELVALMDDALMAEGLVPDGEFPRNWYDALTAIAERTWQVLMRHPWSLHALRNVPPGPNAMRHFEQSLAALAGTKLDAPGKFALLAMVDDYVRGNVLSAGELHAPAATEAERVAAQRFIDAQIATGEFPHTQGLFGGDAPEDAMGRLLGDSSARDRFRAGLSVVLHGVASRLGLRPPAGR